jgi:hypothetical protein
MLRLRPAAPRVAGPIVSNCVSAKASRPPRVGKTFPSRTRIGVQITLTKGHPVGLILLIVLIVILFGGGLGTTFGGWGGGGYGHFGYGGIGIGTILLIVLVVMLLQRA